MALPIASVRYPAVIANKQVANGKIPAAYMQTVKGGGRLFKPAARCWNALVHDFHKETGLYLDYTARTSGGMERTFDQQVALLKSRATRNVELERSSWSRYWAGDPQGPARWYGRPGTAMVATPGTSNHGWGLAIDTALGNGTFTGPVSGLSTTALNWLVKNAAAYGFSWEDQSEPWHIRLVTGDLIPQAVLAFEAGPTPPPPPPPPPPSEDDLTPDEHNWLKTLYAVLWDGDPATPADNQETAAWRISRLAKSLLDAGGQNDNAFWPVMDGRFNALAEKVDTVEPTLALILTRLNQIEAKIGTLGDGAQPGTHVNGTFTGTIS